MIAEDPQSQADQQQQHQSIAMINQLGIDGLTLTYDFSGRFPYWIGLAVFSFVSMIAVLSKNHSFDGAEKWALIVTIVSFILGFVSSLSYVMIRGLFLGQLPEKTMGGIVIGLWGLGIPSIMNPNHNIAVGYEQVTNANLYFFGWAAFICAIMIFGSLLQQQLGVDVRSLSNPKMYKWYGLVASSLIVMGSSIRIFKAFECTLDEMKDVTICRRTKLSISVGVISFWLSAICCYGVQTGLATSQAEFAASSVMLVWWCLGLAYITFGDGPGDAIGNLFFATWVSFVLSVFIFSDCLKDFLVARERVMQQQQQTTHTTMDGEVHTVNETTVTEMTEIPGDF